MVPACTDGYILEYNQYPELLTVHGLFPFSPQHQRVKMDNLGQTQPIEVSFQFCIGCQSLKIRRSHRKSECLASLEKQAKDPPT